MPAPPLTWLPEMAEAGARLKALETAPVVRWADLMALANTRLDVFRTERLDRLLRRHFPDAPALPTKPVRLAFLGSATTGHLAAGIRVGALRRHIHATIHEGDYAQYRTELAQGESLAAFRPDVVLLALDARHLAAGLDAAARPEAADAALGAVMTELEQCWALARERLGAAVIQQTALPVLPALMGSNEQRLPGAPAAFIARVNAALRMAAERAGVHLLAVDARAARDGIEAWHDPVLWHRAKQEVSPMAAPLYGDLVGRLLAALQGRSAKCLVLDLDNTVWGGVIGDDGLEGIAIGQGSAEGEAHLAVQDYARALARRGVILAVCSKNDEANALAPFEKHPDMLLKRSDIAAFVANWDDKATNLRRIAAALNIGIDSLVFLDDNPFERNLVRGALPDVAVPEIPGDDPALMPQILADAGYFEALALTEEDRARNQQYQANRERAALESAATDLPAYLRSLDMELVWRRFDGVGLSRIVQLINKTNQFNLTTRRKTEAQVRAIMADQAAFGIQLRLTDRFGDNGVIAIVIGQCDAGGRCHIETWLMSCRVLGRGVEQATLGIVAAEARALGAHTLVGEYIPSAKNGMVAGHYPGLGFTPAGDGLFHLALDGFAPGPVLMTITQSRQS